MSPVLERSGPSRRPSARSLLISLLGDVVLPSGGRAWGAALTRGMQAMGVSDGATRQALRRLVEQDLVASQRHGRHARYHLTDRGRRRFEEAADRIYLRRDLAWDGQWRLLTYTFSERDRGARDALRRELTWMGYGSIGPGTWVCPWDLGTRLQVVLDTHRIAGDVEVFTSIHDGEDAALAARAYDLDALRRAHANFLDDLATDHTPASDLDALAARVLLVHRWRKFLFLDPGLPDDLVPADWLGDRAVRTFVDRYGQVEQSAWEAWDSIVADVAPDGVVPSHRSNLERTRAATSTRAAPAPAHHRPAGTDQAAPDSHRTTPVQAIERRTEEFLQRIRDGHLVEPTDWMPDDYRRLNIKFIEMHANSEIMGALPEREWIARAPTLLRKRSLAAKVQDEVGHGQLIYRVAESLGRSRRAMVEDLVNGRSSFHNVFHYPTHSWGDVACIGFLVDGAAIVTQRALLQTSYGPYVRVMKRVVAEESLHFRHGEDVMLALAAGTDQQFEMLQEAVTRWWEPIMHFFGTDLAAEDDPSIHWGVKTQTNETSRQAWMSQYVPRMWDMGLELPDPTLHWDADGEVWRYEEPDWDRLRAIVKGDGTEATRYRLWWRQLMHRNHDWLRDVLLGSSDGVVTAA